MLRLIIRMLRENDGATAIEYGMICALVFLVAVSAITSFGNKASAVFISVANAINGVMK